MSEGKNEDEKLTVSKVYETLKSGQFLKSLYWDVLSELKEKPTFKHMKETIKKIVNEKLDTLETLPANKSDGEVEKSIVNEICSLAITVDTVYSKILFVKLEKEFNSQILNIIKDLRNEGEISDDVWAELEIPSTSFDENVKGANNSTMQKTETPIKSVPMSVKKEKQNITCNEDKELQNQKNVPKNNTEKGKSIPQRKMETRSRVVPKTSPVAASTPKKNLPGKSNSKNHAEVKIDVNTLPDKDQVISKGTTSPVATHSPKKKKLPEKNSNKDDEVEIDVVNTDEDKDSDTDSVISVGHISLASVSSVHTSDLSSFDDEISVSSGDEGTKRRMSVKALVAQRVAGKLNGIKKETSNSPEASVETSDKEAESAMSESFSSKRVRKPNSKYSSDTILCQSVKVKDRKKPNVSTKNEDEKNSRETSPKRKRTSDSEIDMPSKIQKMDIVKENNSSEDKNTSKRNESSDYKPVSSVRPLTSRRTAPVTLYSTKP